MSSELSELRQDIISFAYNYICQDVSDRYENYKFPRHIFNKLGEKGFLKNGIPSNYYGNDTGAQFFVILLEEIARYDSSAAVVLIPVYQTNQAILKFGDEDQKNYYLKNIVNGEKVGAFVLTEAGAGSDLRALRTSAEKVDGGFLLNGKKAHITNAVNADVYIVFAQTEFGLSAFIVEKGFEGFKIENKEASMGFRAGYHGELLFENCFVPENNLLGDIGQGLKIALSTLNYSRIGAASISIGIARAAINDAITYAKERTLFNSYLSDFQGQRWKIANLLTELEAGILLRNQAAEELDEGNEVAKKSSMAKLFCSKIATNIALEAIQIAGAHGVMENEAYKRYLLDAKSYEIAGGSNETLLNTIANYTLGKHRKN